MPRHEHTYWVRSVQPLTMLCTLLPLVLVLEITLAVSGLDLSADRIAARVQMRQMLEFFGLSPVVVLHGTGVLIVAVLLVWQAMTGTPWRVNLLDPARSLLEGVIASTPLLACAFFVGALRTHPLASPAFDVTTALDATTVAIGAGLTEELVFRMVGFAICHWLLVDCLRLGEGPALVTTVIITTVAFVMYHDPNAMGPVGTAFVALAGLYLGSLYVFRGFAIAVVAHTAYDLVVLL